MGTGSRTGFVRSEEYNRSKHAHVHVSERTERVYSVMKRIPSQAWLVPPRVKTHTLPHRPGGRFVLDTLPPLHQTQGQSTNTIEEAKARQVRPVRLPADC